MCDNDLIAENLMQNLQITSSVDHDEEDEQEESEDKQEESDEEDEQEEDDDIVEIGVVKRLKLSRFPSPFKTIAGGFPAWLDPINLPSGTSTICGICGDPLQFLIQVYAPSEKESTFHRTLFIFMCPSMKCLLEDQHEQRKHPSNNPSRSVKVFRCQLPRSNKFYASEALDHNDGKVKAALCSWCKTWKGCSVCVNCRSACYCSKKHQAAHWRKGHNFECRNLAVDRQHIESNFAANNTIWPQFKIGIRVEPKDDMMSENGGYATGLSSAGNVDEEFNPLLYSVEADADTRSWAIFEERVSRVPGQVLRYCRNVGASPLWPISSNRPSETDVPRCCYCGGPRCFEFQIMPQLLHHFGVQNDENSLDWSTIVIYTCEASCDGSMAYKEEFAWVQLLN
ncbi:Programmed cell death protein 2 [Heracleum sosnowskyi]|uniref:Programmed cell death protein 2 n=1 Tax=Heracleum sosnowskyi TaxID=360622 RepID=A0AAD8LXZ9_9APIA|nr:Programmed cell death protein 2 [Heracleum sosnowskyi]